MQSLAIALYFIGRREKRFAPGSSLTGLGTHELSKPHTPKYSLTGFGTHELSQMFRRAPHVRRFCTHRIRTGSSLTGFGTHELSKPHAHTHSASTLSRASARMS